MNKLTACLIAFFQCLKPIIIASAATVFKSLTLIGRVIVKVSDKYAIARPHFRLLGAHHLKISTLDLRKARSGHTLNLV